MPLRLYSSLVLAGPQSYFLFIDIIQLFKKLITLVFSCSLANEMNAHFHYPTFVLAKL